MSRNDSWGLCLSTDQNEYYSSNYCDPDFLQDIVDCFDLPEREDVQVSRSNIEAYVRQNELDNKPEGLFKHELNELKKYLAISVCETFYMHAYW